MEEKALWQTCFMAAPKRCREFELSFSSVERKDQRTLAPRYRLNCTTVTKRRSCTTTADAPMGPAQPKSTVLSPAEEAVIVEFKCQMLLPLDDVMGLFT